jgi:two-component system, NarL family, nitrate/nitrite response regulator NarL
MACAFERAAFEEDAMSLQATKERVAVRQKSYVTPESEQIRKQLKELVDACATWEEPRKWQHTAGMREEILFEASVRGVQYYVIRCQPEQHQQVQLSPRELTIAKLIASGLPNKSIGDILEISPWTVATHLRRIFVKLNVTSRAAMVARLVEENFL